MKKSACLLVLALVGFVGCMTTESQIKKSYELGQSNRVNVGEAMVSRSEIVKMKGFSKAVSGIEEIPSWKEELVYSGCAGREIHITYREYSGSSHGLYARPAFSQELHYDADSKLIVFKRYRIRVTEADNESIIYSIIAD